MQIETSERGEVTVLTISGNFQNQDSRTLQKLFQELVDGGKFKIVADLSELAYLNSAALGILVSTMKSARSRKGDLKLSGLKGLAMDVFRITRLSSVFQLHPSIDEAIASFKEE
ncbi:STAS domain-containing protein [bacterium]|nr:STAS domain-containing protein [bacterium]